MLLYILTMHKKVTHWVPRGSVTLPELTKQVRVSAIESVSYRYRSCRRRPAGAWARTSKPPARPRASCWTRTAAGWAAGSRISYSLLFFYSRRSASCLILFFCLSSLLIRRNCARASARTQVWCAVCTSARAARVIVGAAVYVTPPTGVAANSQSERRWCHSN